MKHILFLLALAPALALAQTGTVKDSVRVLTTAEIEAGAANDTANFYFIQNGSWKKIRMDSLFNYMRFEGMVDTFRAQTINGAKTFATAPTFNTALGGGSGGTGLTTFGAANRIPYSASTTALTTGAGLTYDGTNFVTTGTASATKFIATGGTAAGYGMYRTGNNLAFTGNGNEGFRIDANGTILAGATSNFAGGPKLYISKPTLSEELMRIDGSGGAGVFIFANDTSFAWRMVSNARVALGQGNNYSPTAWLELQDGNANLGSAPLKFQSGTVLTTPEVGAMEYNNLGGNIGRLYFTPDGGADSRYTINMGLTATATIDFAEIAVNGAQTSADISVSGAALGDVVSIGVPNDCVLDDVIFFGWVSGAGNVKIRAINNSSTNARNPPSGSFKVFVTKF